jgi:uncharacterized membrane protein
MKDDVKRLLISYTIIHGLGSLISWIMFTSNHPFRELPSENLRYGISVIFIILIYLLMGYITMLARAKFLKSTEDAFHFTGIIIGLNLFSAIIYWIGSSQLALEWMKVVAVIINFPGYLFLLTSNLSLLNLSMIVILPPLSYMLGLLIRQAHH